MPYFTNRGIIPLAAGGGAYTANAVDLGGTAYLLRGAALTSAPNTSVGLVSFWFKMMGGDGNFHVMIEDTLQSVFTFRRENTNIFHLMAGASGANVLIDSTSTFTAGGAWRHILCAWNGTTRQLYVDDVSDIGTNSGSGAAIDYNAAGTTEWGVFNRVSGNSFLCNMQIAEYYINFDATLDISSPANRAKFISGGLPVSLGTDGSLPTGAQPIIYLKDPAATYNVNSGYGGNFTLTGTPTDVTAP